MSPPRSGARGSEPPGGGGLPDPPWRRRPVAWYRTAVGAVRTLQPRLRAARGWSGAVSPAGRAGSGSRAAATSLKATNHVFFSSGREKNDARRLAFVVAISART